MGKENLIVLVEGLEEAKMEGGRRNSPVVMKAGRLLGATRMGNEEGRRRKAEGERRG